MRLGEVVDLVFAGVDAACRHFVQHWLPEMRPGAVHQSDARQPAPAEAFPEAGSKFEPRRAATDHDNAVQGVVSKGLVLAHHHQFVNLGRGLIAAIDARIRVFPLVHVIDAFWIAAALR